ncbi:hypothetical protein LV716_00190 [Flagellimonas sp. HMM57]|nr:MULTISPECIES: hypothetical protein [unclassified Flagellimonas]UII76253.1 hypothetical protein LV716_00190 [Flagellimonas sp. HMM57]
MKDLKEFNVEEMSKSEQENTNGGFLGLIGFVIGVIAGWAIIDGQF